MSDKRRASFERWAKQPPREWDTLRNPMDPKSAWPGQYARYPVQCAWEAWEYVCEQAARQLNQRGGE